MTNYNVVPKGNGKKGWKVESNGRNVSPHRKKAPAMAEARRLASPGDTITKHNRHGRIQDKITVR